MADLLNVKEIVDFAVYIEQNGYEFYTDTAKKFDNEKMMELFHYLAEEELKHEKTFKQLKEEVGSFTPHESYEGEYGTYMRDFLKSHTLGNNKVVKEKIAAVKTIDDAIKVALDFEKDSVVFFASLKKFVGPNNVETVEKIVQEEVSHITMLYRLSKEYQS